MFHLTVRVAWHDNRWNGTVCRHPSANTFCTLLERIRESKQDEAEEALAARTWDQVPVDQLPSCVAEGAGFMSPRDWVRVMEHPYQKSSHTTHGHLRPTRIVIPPYATLAVPFWWMLKSNQAAIDDQSPVPLPPDEEAPFSTAWVFGRERQMALNDLFYGRLTPQGSLVLFYAKDGHPLGDDLSRLIVGIGRIEHVSDRLMYNSTDPQRSYPLWERVIRHSIRPDGTDGFLLPYHDYLEPTGDPAEDQRRQDLLREIAVTVDTAHQRAFSYGSELAGADAALEVLTRSLEAVRRVRAHGIAAGPWMQREEWINQQIAALWQDRGAFPGLGSALEALGLRLGTALSLELITSGRIDPMDDPWPLVDALLRGELDPPRPEYRPDLDAVRKTWASLPDERRSLLHLLSRFALSPAQAKRWFDVQQRENTAGCRISDADLLANPYRIAELDVDHPDAPAISVGMLDRGLLPDASIATRHPVPSPSAVASPIDVRRVRAGLVRVLRDAAEQGDTLLADGEALRRLPQLDWAQPCEVGLDYLHAHRDDWGDAIATLDLPSGSGTGLRHALQLTEYQAREAYLRKVLLARAGAVLPSVGTDWKTAIHRTLARKGVQLDPNVPSHAAALEEQAAALERITTRKLSVLAGKAGTGKTTVLGALLQSDAIRRDGVLLLAPTGKARVRLQQTAGFEALTIAQFLLRLGRYDVERQRPLLSGGSPYRGEKTVVIDECSMLTLDDMTAVFKAIDLSHVTRILLVGDPNQLPPIGPGRPFADLVGYFDHAADSTLPKERHLADALARLTVEVRAQAGAPSDTLKLAAWFTREPQAANADAIFRRLSSAEPLNDLQVKFWNSSAELEARLLEAMCERLGLQGPDDVKGFNRVLGIESNGYVPSNQPDSVESFQILSPVRMHPHGVLALNRWIQARFRENELKQAHRFPHRHVRLGDEEIVLHDKVLQTRNTRRDGWNWEAKQSVQGIYLANGEIGIAVNEHVKGKNKWLNVLFSGRPNITVGYRGKDFTEDAPPLELAYALTVHKAQGSEFDTVFVILPKSSRLLSTELIYTALTRARRKLVLFIEGEDISLLYHLSRPEASETARRNTNLFTAGVREADAAVPYAEHLIHRTERGHLVRSKSELVIANTLHHMGLPYEYERPLTGPFTGGVVLPDFTFVDPAGELIIWEHLGMLGNPDYRQAWEDKLSWYRKNGFELGQNLFTTQDDDHGGLDSVVIRQIAERIAERL
ncbi:AAA family ATPase [Alicyclobacillus macrosporangiidus]|uniref:UvrD-like helicase C-terminal domain-containing protein n=1 Tax=Alicyclobacillus macrosporangiidus TaxID=392015 RepID=A0A1I7LC46_9BACL|nr:AAA family ATPase [Alicyclobacillus macrosporangiidus]SFV07282.1 UvrD-like helicase C-terminal domain-containing protein [Alicyclobacillus macrosporangiidus]